MECFPSNLTHHYGKTRTGISSLTHLHHKKKEVIFQIWVSLAKNYSAILETPSAPNGLTRSCRVCGGPSSSRDIRKGGEAYH